MWNNFNFKFKKKNIQNEDRLVELMLSVLVSYVEDGGIESLLKPKTIKFVFAVQIMKVLHGHSQTCFSFIYGSLIGFFPCISVCLCVRACVENIIAIAVISIDLFHLKVKYFVNIFQNNGFSAWNFTDRIWILEIW